MELIPAIDVLDGRVVRLHRGDYDKVTVYAEDAVALAERFAEAGAKRLHVVDLDGARRGSAKAAPFFEKLVRISSLAVQVGGGIRDRDAAKRWLDAGAARVVLGTSAVKDPTQVEALCVEFPGRVVVALDARKGFVAIEGWIEETAHDVFEFARTVDAWKPAAILFTVVERDGTGEGPAVVETARLQSLVGCDVIASGGIGTLAHIEALAASGVRATVCGKALVSGSIDVRSAMRAAEGPR
jgi:phosphoribosylformimino-5-aminoimidazole carboxamide ribotide isomerase